MLIRWRPLRQREKRKAGQQSLGLPWSELEALFGRDIQALELETTDAGGGLPPFFLTWTENNIRKSDKVGVLPVVELWLVSRLIRAFGVRTVTATNDCRPSLVHWTLMEGQLGCAKLLFDYAAEQQYHVSLHWRMGEDILNWLMTNKSKRVAEFVLQRMAEQCSSPEETADCLRRNFKQLVQQCPQVMQNYIMSDKFCCEYGRFDVPQSLFADRADAPIALLGEAPNSWRPAEGSNEVKEFWERRGLSDFVDLDSTSETKVSAVSKFLCIDLSKVNDHQMVVKTLLSPNYPVEVFKTQSIKNFVQWRWIVRVRGAAVIKFLFNVLASVLLFLIIAVAWNDKPTNSRAENWLVALVLFATFIARIRLQTLWRRGE